MSRVSQRERVSVEVFAPASVANVAVGFDVLGFAFAALGDRVKVERIEAPLVELRSVRWENPDEITPLPVDPAANAATFGLIQLIKDKKLNYGFAVAIEKGIPLGSGMGGSAASAVGAIVGANELLSERLSQEEMLHYALQGEALVSGGRHADNIAPCLYGGLTLVVSLDPLEVLALPLPTGLYAVVAHPHLRLDTRESRGILRQDLALNAHVHQSARLAAFVSACYRGDSALIGRVLRDEIIEPQRASKIPGFSAVQSAALRNGALGCSISGSGPSVFALTTSAEKALNVKNAMIDAFLSKGRLRADGWIEPLSTQGARVLNP